MLVFPPIVIIFLFYSISYIIFEDELACLALVIVLGIFSLLQVVYGFVNLVLEEVRG